MNFAQMKLILKLAARNVWRNRRRSMLVIGTLILGGTSLLIFYGFNHGLMDQYRANTIRSRFGHGQIFLKNYYEGVYEKPSDHWMDAGPVIETLKQTPSVQFIFPRIQFFALLSNGQINLSGRGLAVDGMQESEFFKQLNVEEGKDLTDEQDGIVLGKGLARALKAKVGDRVTVLTNTVSGQLNGADLNVVGIFHTGFKDYDDVAFRVQLKQAQFLIDTPKVESIALGLDESRPWSEIEQEIQNKHPEVESIPFEVLDKVYYMNSVIWLEQQFQIIKTIILSIILLGILSTVSNTILERSREVGNLRANGESPNKVLSLFIAESFLLGIVGSVLASFTSFALQNTILRNGVLMPAAPGLTRQYYILIDVTFAHTFEMIFLVVITSLIATAVAGWGVVRKPIADLLRT
jgi:putative ABC transport system permease protein